MCFSLLPLSYLRKSKWKKYLEILSFYTCVPQMTIIWRIVLEIWSATDRIFCHFWTIFCPFCPINPKIQNFEKIKKISGDIVVIHKCTKNHYHMLHCSWDATVILSYFLSFWPLTTQKIKTLKKKTKKTRTSQSAIFEFWDLDTNEYLILNHLLLFFKMYI